MITEFLKRNKLYILDLNLKFKFDMLVENHEFFKYGMPLMFLGFREKKNKFWKSLLKMYTTGTELEHLTDYSIKLKI